MQFKNQAIAAILKNVNNDTDQKKNRFDHYSAFLRLVFYANLLTKTGNALNHVVNSKKYSVFSEYSGFLKNIFRYGWIDAVYQREY